VLISFLPIKAANTLSMHQDGEDSDQEPDLQDQKSWTLG
jgi:hypothetical protein